MKLRNLILVTALLLASQIATAVRTDNRLCLGNNRPVASWEEALPSSNGRLGVMVSGSVAEDKLQLNEVTSWSGSPNYNVSDYRRQLDQHMATPLASVNEKVLHKAQGRNTNTLMQTYQLTAPLIADRSKLTPVGISQTYLYDVPVKAGRTHTFVVLG